MNGTQSQDAKFQALYDAYGAQLPARIMEIDALWARAETGSDSDAMQSLHRALHSLAGSAGTFGRSELGKIAKALELPIATLLDGATPPRGALDPLAPVLDRLRQAATIPGRSASEQAGAATNEHQDIGRPSESRLIYLVEDDQQQAQLVAHHLGRFGYFVRSFGDGLSFREAVAREMPAAAVLDIVLPEGRLAGTEASAALKTAATDRVPIVFVSVRSDYEARVHAVRAGGAVYLTKPLDLIELITALDKLIRSRDSDPYRVLLVDDSAPEAEYFSHALRLAGMDTRVATDPESTLDRLAEFDPDLVLMDMYLRDCRGDELARVIRQMTQYTSLPIVFLSAETDFDRQLDAMQRAGDEFLTKPIRPAQLVKAVSTRIAHQRELRALMTQDSLTGLSNHRQLHRQLEAELARAQRNNSALSFAMIDVDHFKAVNGSYGHGMGDDVLRTLARFLRLRLRQADVVGRYGGEEFAVVLTDTDAPAAARVIDKLREDFALMKHRAPDGEFCVTFSAGIASIWPSAKPSNLMIAADNGLYQAKRAGRNRVVVVSQ